MLLVQAATRRQVRVPLEPDRPSIVGSGASADVRIEDGGLLPRHVQFARRHDEVIAQPVDAAPLTLNGRPLSEPVALASGDWLGLGSVLFQVRLALRILLLVGVRTGELLKARWADVELEAAIWTIPVENQKLNPKQIADAKPWIVPLAPDVLALFRELKKIAGRSPWVVSSDKAEEGHVTEKALSHAVRGLFDAKLLELPGGRCTPHDLRRTLRTKLGDLVVALHVAERCLNHSLGRIAQTYDHYDYLKERRDALEKWEAYVYRLIAPGNSNVAFLPAARGG